MTQSVAENEDDLLTLMFMLCGGMATGMFSFGVLLHPVRDWMLQYHLLANGTEVVIPFIDGIGFGWPQIVVASGDRRPGGHRRLAAPPRPRACLTRSTNYETKRGG